MRKFSKDEQDKIWKSFVERCATGDVSACRLYFEMLANKKKPPNSQPVVVIYGDSKIHE